MKLHFGDEQFEVDAAQLPVAFTQVTLKGQKTERGDQNVENNFPPFLLTFAGFKQIILVFGGNSLWLFG